MAIDKTLLSQKLAQLEEYIQDVNALKNKPREEYIRRHPTEDLAERRLEKAVQCAIDIASYIVTREAMGNPGQYRDLFHFLGREGITDAALTERLEKMAGFRNILIHEYSYIEEELVYDAVQKGINDLILFSQAIKKKFIG